MRLHGLDYMRATAILLVVIGHLAATREFGSNTVFSFLEAGAGIGVDLFFALSGFLIGGLLFDLSERDPSPHDWLIFMLRRWMRTVPAYWVWISILALMAPISPTIWFRYATFTQNLAEIPLEDWFGVSWSLSVEEWFYLFFSAALLSAAAMRRRQGMFLVVLAFVIVPLAARVSMLPFLGAVTKYVAFLRLDAIALGVLAAWSMRYEKVTAVRPLFFIGVALILVAWFIAAAPHSPLAVFAEVTLAGVGSAMVLPAVATASLAPSRVAFWVSSRSYALYLVHQTMMAVFTELHAFGALASVVASGLIAEASYRYFETPILKIRPKQV